MNTSEIKETILNLFRQSKCKAGQFVPMRTIEAKFFRLRVNFADAANELIRDGILVYDNQKPLPGLFLTEQGYNAIYDCRSDKQLMDLVMEQFRKTMCKVGQGYMFRTLKMAVIDNLNPKEQSRIYVVLDGMIDNDFITVEFENEYPTFLKLTEKGYHYIYG